ncbi:MAG TPA: ABC transporter ATP-binding protein [Propionibacteriaceae bacterium]|nr:ABC transporter ATP-binding protein [Propionibacteriaceae bacterium]
MTTHAIEISGLVKRFGSTVALDGLTMAVPTGQVHGFLGPNGAGKSTTIRVLLGLLRSDAGTARLLGGDPWHDAARLHRRLAYVPGDVNLWPNLTGGEAIDVIGRARGGLDKAKRAMLIERFELDPTKKGRAYSKGNRQKVALVAALASDVDLLLLDEPTSGLDPLMEKVFSDVILSERRENTTVLLSSHILSEVEQLCDHVSIIREGRIVESGTLDQLRHLHRTRVGATIHDTSVLRTLPGVYDLVTEDGRTTFEAEEDAMPSVLAALARAGAKGVTATPPSLEELFLSHYDSRTPEKALV